MSDQSFDDVTTEQQNILREAYAKYLAQYNKHYSKASTVDGHDLHCAFAILDLEKAEGKTFAPGTTMKFYEYLDRIAKEVHNVSEHTFTVPEG